MGLSTRALIVVALLVAAACGAPTAPSPPPVVQPPPLPVQPPVAPPALTISCPANLTAVSPAGVPVPITFATPTSSGGATPVQVSCSRQSGSLFNVGATPVQCMATDAAGQSSVCQFTVTITVPIPQLTRTKFLAFGDSLTAGEVGIATSGVGTNVKFLVVPSASYPSQLANLLKARYTTQASAIEVLNFGQPGEWAQDGVQRLPVVLANNRPEVVLLLHGINDIAAELELGVSRGITALDSMAKEARNRGARVMLATLPPPLPGATHAVTTQLVADFNDRVRVMARGEGAVLIDIYAALVSDIKRYIGGDGLHLTEAGYLRVAELFRDAVRAELEVR